MQRIVAIIAGVALGGALQLAISGRALQPYATEAISVPPPPPTAHSVEPQDVEPRMLFPELVPPAENASDEEWLAFAMQVNATPNGTRHDNHDYTTPLLPWYAYIARYNPAAIYQLFASHKISDRTLSHLLQFGLLPDWYQELPDARDLLLDDATALISLATHRGVDYARAELIEAIRAKGEKPFRISGVHLGFAMEAMPPQEVEQLFKRVTQCSDSVDPRALRTIAALPELQGREAELREAIARQAGAAYQSPAMSSYLLHAAELGDKGAVERMLDNAGDNAAQPTNFYCSGCYLALLGDGLVGSALIEQMNGGKRVYVHPLQGREGAHEYLLSLDASGGER